MFFEHSISEANMASRPTDQIATAALPESKKVHQLQLVCLLKLVTLNGLPKIETAEDMPTILKL